MDKCTCGFITVINVELADRIHDLLDVDYLKNLEPSAAEIRLANKIKRNELIVKNAARGKNINEKMLSFFYFLIGLRSKIPRAAPSGAAFRIGTNRISGKRKR